MKKISVMFFCALFLTFGFSFVTSTSAQSPQSPTYYVNDNGIKMTEVQYNNLLSQGFEPFDIQIMDKESFTLNKDITASEISKVIKYVKTTTSYDQNTSIVVLDKPVQTSVSTELTKDEMDLEVAQEKERQAIKESGFKIAGTETGYDSTTYKKLTTVVSKLSTNTYRSNNTLEWLIIPTTRQMDVLGASVRYPSYWTADHTNRGGTQYWRSKGNVSGTYVYESSTISYGASSGNWTNASFSGAALVQNLKDDYTKNFTVYHVDTLRHTAWFNFTLTGTNYPYTTVNVMGTFTHQIDDAPIAINGFTLTYGAPSIDFSLGNSASHYDGELSATCYITK